jgi:transcriptional regulator with PAS, ATPase and Fis domain
VGAERPLLTQACIIAASNQPLAELVEQGRFRADLYFRLDVLRIDIPPLRARPQDIPIIVRALLDRCDFPRSSQAPIEIAPDAID